MTSLSAFLVLQLVQFVIRCQGVSGAGKQLGLLDGRSVLVKEPFRVYDDLPCGSES